MLIPALKYGGTERIMWWLGKELVKKGHKVTFLVKSGSCCDFADTIAFNPSKSIKSQIPKNTDIIHSHYIIEENFDQPVITTIHGNVPYGLKLPLNSVFVSKNHSERHGSNVYVHNGLDFSDYGNAELNRERTYFHFLAKAAWRIKNIRGAIDVINKLKEKLVVIGGNRFNIKMGFRLTPYFNISFYGMIGGEKKNELLRRSKGLIFPVLWHEPFGIAIIESLYFGCPVFGTPYGSLPELIPAEVGFLSASKKELTEAIKNLDYNPETCHKYAVENFSSLKMAESYILLHKKILNGEMLNNTHPTLKHRQAEKFLLFSN